MSAAPAGSAGAAARVRRAEALIARGTDPRAAAKAVGVPLAELMARIRADLARANGGRTPDPGRVGFRAETAGAAAAAPRPKRRAAWLLLLAGPVLVGGAAGFLWGGGGAPAVPPANPYVVRNVRCQVGDSVRKVPTWSACDGLRAASRATAQTSGKKQTPGFFPTQPAKPHDTGAIPPGAAGTPAPSPPAAAKPVAVPTGRCINPFHRNVWWPCGPAGGRPFTPWDVEPSQTVVHQCAVDMTLWAQQRLTPTEWEVSPAGRMCQAAAADGVRPGSHLYPRDILR
jgi:hypothetical protein